MAVQFNQIRDRAATIAQDAGHAIQHAAGVASEKLQNIKPETVKKVAYVGVGILYAAIAPVATSAGFVVGLACADKVNQGVAKMKSIYAKQNFGVKVLTIAASWVLFSATFPVLPGFTVGLLAGANLRK